MNNPVYIGLSILEINKIVMYTFCYDYVKSKNNKKAKLCYMETDSFIFHHSNYELDRLLSKEKKTKMSLV